jgi:hypothetical protein
LYDKCLITLSHNRPDIIENDETILVIEGSSNMHKENLETLWPKTTLALTQVQPKTTLALTQVRLTTLWPCTSSAHHTLALEPDFQKCLFFIIFDLPYAFIRVKLTPWLPTLPGLTKNWKIYPAKAKNQSHQNKILIMYLTRVIISPGVYIFYPIFEDHFFLFKDIFNEDSDLM